MKYANLFLILMITISQPLFCAQETTNLDPSRKVINIIVINDLQVPGRKRYLSLNLPDQYKPFTLNLGHFIAGVFYNNQEENTIKFNTEEQLTLFWNEIKTMIEKSSSYNRTDIQGIQFTDNILQKIGSRVFTKDFIPQI